MIKVRALQDEGGDWFIIPNNLENKFHKYMNDHSRTPSDWYKYEEKFEEIFSQYRTGGDLNNVQLYKKR